MTLTRMMPVCMFGLCLTPTVAMLGQSAIAASAAVPKALFITILEGEGELNDVRARTAREPIVQVEDENHKPVAGALVLFAIPRGSAGSANFSGLNSLTVRTGADGRAVGNGFRVTRHTGKLEIAVTATVATLEVATVIHETNFAKGSRLRNYTSNHPKLVKSVAGGAIALAVTLIVVETRSDATTITAGAGTVGR